MSSLEIITNKFYEYLSNFIDLNNNFIKELYNFTEINYLKEFLSDDEIIDKIIQYFDKKFYKEKYILSEFKDYYKNINLNLKNRKSPSLYNLYVKDFIIEIKKELPDKNLKDLLNLAAKSWRNDPKAEFIRNFIDNKFIDNNSIDNKSIDNNIRFKYLLAKAKYNNNQNINNIFNYDLTFWENFEIWYKKRNDAALLIQNAIKEWWCRPIHGYYYKKSMEDFYKIANCY